MHRRVRSQKGSHLSTGDKVTKVSEEENGEREMHLRYNKSTNTRAGEMAAQVKVLPAKPVVLTLILEIHMMEGEDQLL